MLEDEPQRVGVRGQRRHLALEEPAGLAVGPVELVETLEESFQAPDELGHIRNGMGSGDAELEEPFDDGPCMGAIVRCLRPVEERRSDHGRLAQDGEPGMAAEEERRRSGPLDRRFPAPEGVRARAIRSPAVDCAFRRA